jgi:hypothetical protein
MLDKLLDEGWGYHDTESARLAAELEAAAAAAPVPAAQLRPFLHLSNHTLGEHLADWPRAATLADRVLAGRQPDADTAHAWGRLWVAQSMSGPGPLDARCGLAAEIPAFAAAPHPQGARLEAGFQLIAALVGSRRTDEAAAIFDAALSAARIMGETAPHRAIAVASNNLASELVEQRSRTPAEARLMVRAADAAHQAWLRAGNWQNEERALYLKVLVANADGRPDDALTDADKALSVIAANGSAPVDAAFLGLARAHAFRLKQAGDCAAAALAAADALAAQFDTEDLKSWYTAERAKLEAP